jgi:hypothetical protein
MSLFDEKMGFQIPRGGNFLGEEPSFFGRAESEKWENYPLQ